MSVLSARGTAGLGGAFTANAVVASCLTLLSSMAACRPSPVAFEGISNRQVTRRNAVGLEVLADPNALRLHLEPGEEFSRPKPLGDLMMPEFPPALRSMNPGRQIVAVRIILDESGCVASARQSPIASSSSGPYSLQFRESVEKALETWRFTPAAVRVLSPGPDLDRDGKPDYKILVSERKFRILFDLRFIFEIERGKPVVRSDRN